MNTREIRLKIEKESDLFSGFDPDQKLLSEEVSLHLARNYLNQHRSMDEKYIIHILSDSPVDERKVKERFHDYYAQELDNLKFSMKRLTLKQISLAVIGILILCVWLYFSSRSERVNVEILAIMGWVAVWEATSIAIMERPELRRMMKTYEQAMNAEIIVHNKA